MLTKIVSGVHNHDYTVNLYEAAKCNHTSAEIGSKCCFAAFEVNHKINVFIVRWTITIAKLYSDFKRLFSEVQMIWFLLSQP